MLFVYNALTPFFLVDLIVRILKYVNHESVHVLSPEMNASVKSINHVEYTPTWLFISEECGLITVNKTYIICSLVHKLASDRLSW